jgi:hypothetical protein
MDYSRPTPVAQWLAQSVARAITYSDSVERNTGLTVVVNSSLTSMCVIDRDQGRIELRASMGVKSFLEVLRRVELHLQSGGALTPEFHPECLTPPNSGIVVPLRRYHTAS